MPAEPEAGIATAPLLSYTQGFILPLVRITDWGLLTNLGRQKR
jgi:hypothetical protein